MPFGNRRERNQRGTDSLEPVLETGQARHVL